MVVGDEVLERARYQQLLLAPRFASQASRATPNRYTHKRLIAGQAFQRLHAAALSGGGEHLGDRRLQPLVGIRGDQLHAAQAAPGQRTQELDPERFGLAVADRHAAHLAAAIGADAAGDNDGHRDDVTGAAGARIRGVQPELGPFVLDRPREEACGNRTLPRNTAVAAAVDKSPACARLSLVAPAAYLPTWGNRG